MIIVLALVIAFLLALPWYLEEKRRRIHREARENAKGDFAVLSHGITHYRWHGLKRGPIIVCVHGLTTPSDGLVPVAEEFVKLGFRVLTYDLYGRGLSDAPRDDQTTEFFIQQLDDLLEHQGIEDGFTLLGYSMGGTIVTHFAAQKPERVDRVILLASAGIKTKESAFARFCRTTPALGDWVFEVFGPKRARDAIAMDTRIHQSKEIGFIQMAELDRRGYWRSVLSSRRGALQDGTEHEHRKLGRREIPVIAVWGNDDDVVPVEAADMLQSWNSRAKQLVVIGAGHGLPYTHAANIGNRIRPHVLARD